MPTDLRTSQARIDARTVLHLPADVTLHRQAGSESGWYALRHGHEGLLGRVRVVGTPTGPYRIDGEVSGDRDDPATQRRADLFRGVTAPLLDALSTLGNGPERLLQEGCEDSVSADGAKVDPQAIPCDRCGQPFAFHVYCSALTPAAFADVARLTFRFWGRLKVPTWIIGAPVPEDIKSRRHADVRSAIAQVWPERGSIELLAPADFNPKMRELERNHCRR